jgi:hypothetical protein
LGSKQQRLIDNKAQMLQIYQSQKAEMSLVFQEQKKIQELIDRERQKELAIQAEIAEIAQVLSQRIKHL